jgi:hypothetical protein
MKLLQLATFIVAGAIFGDGGFVTGFLAGLFVFFAYFTARAMRSAGWDRSNMFNPIRALAYYAVHPDAFPHLVDKRNGRRPFWYVSGDEFKDVVRTAQTPTHDTEQGND